MYVHAVPMTKLYDHPLRGWIVFAPSVFDAIKGHRFLCDSLGRSDQGIRNPAQGLPQRASSQPPPRKLKASTSSGSKRKASAPPRTPPPTPSVPFEEEAYQCRSCQANLCVEYDYPHEHCLYCRDRIERAQNYCRCCGRTISDDAAEDLCYGCFGLAKPWQGEYRGFQ